MYSIFTLLPSRRRSSRQPARPVRDLDRNHLRNGRDVARLAQHLRARLPVGQNQPQDAELLGIRQHQGAYIDSGTGQHPAGLDHLARDVLQEQRQLVNFHGSALPAVDHALRFSLAALQRVRLDQPDGHAQPHRVLDRVDQALLDSPARPPCR